MSEIVKIDPKEYGLEETKAADIAAQFRPMLDKMVELEKEFNQIIILPIEEKETARKAKELRLKYVKVRTGTAEIHKQQKAFYLAGGRFVDGWKNAQLFASEGIEKRLEEIEKYAEIQEKKRIEALQFEREKELEPYEVENLSALNLGEMSDAVWSAFKDGNIKHYNDRKEAERKAESERIEAQRKIDLHNERKESVLHLWNFTTEFEKTLNFGEQSQGDFDAIVVRLNKAKADHDSMIEAQRIENERLKKEAEEKERIRIEEQKKADEAARIERELAAAKLKAETDEKNRIAAELKKKQDAEKAEADRIAKEAAEKAEAERKAAEAPDMEKLNYLAVTISNISLPEMSTDEGKKILSDVKVLLDKVTKFIATKTK